jgi:hypothetical protein
MKRLLALTLLLASCNESFDAGRKKYDKLPVDGRNPIILLNDSAGENWMGEYAMLLSNSGGPELVGIIVTTGGRNTDLLENKKGWLRMVAAARAGGLQNIPDPTESSNEKLVKPVSGDIMDTDISTTYSNGAKLIVDESKSRSLPYSPLVVVAGSRLTDVACAYLKDQGVAERVVVVASVGELTSSGANMGIPNGEMDPWADTIVATKFRWYIQVSARYNSKLDVPGERLEELPRFNSFSDWIWYKQPNIWETPASSDQVAIAAVGIPGFVNEVYAVSPDPTADAGATVGPSLQHDQNGKVLLVRGISPDAAINRLWQMLRDPKLFPTSPDASTDTK